MADPTKPESDRFAIVDLADEWQVRKQTIFKIAKRLRIQPSQRREADRRNQLVATITSEQAGVIRRELEASAEPNRESVTGTETPAALGVEDGVFYILQLEPEHDPGRLKVGFTTDLEGRLRKHRCSAPLLVCLKSWPCRRTWERATIDCTTYGVEQLHREVFRTASVEEVVGRADRFFAMMPPVASGSESGDEQSENDTG